MREEIARLLELQQWDLETQRLEMELNDSAPQRKIVVETVLTRKEGVGKLKQRWMQAELNRKKAEAQIVQLQEQGRKFATQQLQTKKNEEYRSLEALIQKTKKEISEWETRALEFMEEEESSKKVYETAHQESLNADKVSKKQLQEMDELKAAHTKAIQERKVKRSVLAERVPAALRLQYERMFRNKGGHVLVGIDDKACGGCHIALPYQTILSCRADEPNVLCINCGRILYYSPEMRGID